MGALLALAASAGGAWAMVARPATIRRRRWRRSASGTWSIDLKVSSSATHQVVLLHRGDAAPGRAVSRGPAAPGGKIDTAPLTLR